jgi:hypothetical protein
MKHYIRHSLSFIALLLLALAPLGIALAHGEPEIAVDPTVVAAGSTITITGSSMEDGNTYTMTLEGVKGSIPLGVATAKGEGEAAGFVVQYTVPDSTTPSSYTVRAVTPDGDVATADLTVTAASTQASAGPATGAMAPMASAEPHVLDRTKPVGEIIGVVAVIALSSIGGFVLVRRRG